MKRRLTAMSGSLGRNWPADVSGAAGDVRRVRICDISASPQPRVIARHGFDLRGIVLDRILQSSVRNRRFVR
jgi:hypothetical protein